MDDGQTTKPRSRHLVVGLLAVGFALVYIVRAFLVPWPPACVLMPLTLLALLCGGISVLAGLVVKANRERLRLWEHIGVLLAIIIVSLLTLGPFNFLRVLDLRLRTDVTRTGGRDQLSTWARDLLEKSREQMGEHDVNWRVPREYWSEQVRRLHPKWVSVQVMFEDDQKGVCLCYGGGFLHYTLVVGPPGSRPHPNLDDPNSDNSWVRWADGIFIWIQG